MRKHKGRFSIIVVMAILMAIGLIVMYTIGPVRANFQNAAAGKELYPESYYFVHQLISVGLSLAAFILMTKIPYKKFVDKASVLFWFSMALCLILFVCGKLNIPLAQCTNGACRWINLGQISVQPADIVKFALVFYYAKIFTEYRKGHDGDVDFRNNWDRIKREPKRELKKVSRSFWTKFLISTGLSIGFIMGCQKDMGSAIPIVTMALAMIVVAGFSWKVIGTFAVAGVLIAVGATVTSPHRMERIATQFGMSQGTDEEDDANSYQIDNALLAIGTGGFFGVGIGNSVQATGYLPESINDSIFAIIGELFGFVGLVAIVLLFAYLLSVSLNVADRSRDFTSYLIANAIFAWIFTQFAVNITAMTKIIPLTGITLPFLSYGGTSMMVISAAMGVLFQTSEYTSFQKVSEKERAEYSGLKDSSKETRGFRREFDLENVQSANRRIEINRRRR